MMAETVSAIREEAMGLEAELLRSRLKEARMASRAQWAEIARLQQEAIEREAENARLFGGIQKLLDMGAPRIEGPEPNKCAHGVWDWDECAGCNDAALEALLSPSVSGSQKDPLPGNT